MNKFKTALFLAARVIKRGDKGSLFLTIVIMMVVFLNLLFIDSIFAGISRTMDEVKIDYQYGEVIVEPATREKYIQNTQEIIDKIKDFYYVKSLTARLQTGAVAINDKNNDGRDVVTMGAQVVGIDLENDNLVANIKGKVFAGRYLQGGDRGKAIIGSDLAGGYGSSVFPKDLEGVKVGSKIEVRYDNGITREYDIVGVYKTKNFDTDSKILVTRRELDSVLQTGSNEATSIIIRLMDKSLAPQAMDDFKKFNFSGADFFDWHDKLAFGRSINKSFDVIGAILRYIGALVAGLVIFIIIFVDIVNRRRQIGILKAMGISENIIITSYVLRGIFYTLIGMVAGYLVMQLGVIGFFHKHPIDFPMGDMVPFIKQESLRMSIILFFVAGLIGSLVPAFREVKKRILFLMK